jgi:hypothetical protein
MFLLIFLNYLFIFQVRRKFIFQLRKYHERLGNDERYPLIDDRKEMLKIIENFKKKELLEYLRYNNTNIINKMYKVNEYYGKMPKPMNLLNGGLLEDWNFEI